MADISCLDNWCRKGCLIGGREEYEGYVGLSCKGVISGLLGTAIFIIGCLGAAGVMTTGMMTGAVIGLGAAAFACTLVNGGFATASTWLQIVKYATIIALAAIVMTTNMLSGVQLGYGLVGTSLGGFGLICAATFVEIKCKNAKDYT